MKRESEEERRKRVERKHILYPFAFDCEKLRQQRSEKGEEGEENGTKVGNKRDISRVSNQRTFCMLDHELAA